MIDFWTTVLTVSCIHGLNTWKFLAGARCDCWVSSPAVWALDSINIITCEGNMTVITMNKLRLDSCYSLKTSAKVEYRALFNVL